VTILEEDLSLLSRGRGTKTSDNSGNNNLKASKKKEEEKEVEEEEDDNDDDEEESGAIEEAERGRGSGRPHRGRISKAQRKKMKKGIPPEKSTAHDCRKSSVVDADKDSRSYEKLSSNRTLPDFQLSESDVCVVVKICHFSNLPGEEELAGAGAGAGADRVLIDDDGVQHSDFEDSVALIPMTPLDKWSSFFYAFKCRDKYNH
jgi:hypothetical protein